MENLSNRVIKGYELRERIGAGGFGAVYRAYQPSVGREVAIKVILPQHANHPDFIRRFEFEAQLIARLEHPHIVPMYDYWRDPDGAYLVMRWLNGSLRSAIQRGSWSVESSARLLEQIAGALTVAHRDGIVHRDIKPDNILLDEDDNAYLADFGIAKDLAVGDMTEEGALVGSPAYITPEQIKGEPITARADIYSLGLVMYEILVNEKPYPGATTPYELINKHLNEPLPSLNAQRSNLPAALNEVLQTATAKDPSHRYANVLRFASAFRAVLPSVQRGPAQPLPEPLTERELDILRLMVEGCDNNEIAQRLVVSLATVRWYVKQIYVKLDVHSRHQAIERAQQLNLNGRPQSKAEPEPIVVTSHSMFLPDLVNPYKGLRAFQEADAEDFFGRAALTEQLLARLAESGDGGRFLVVVGPSGSGKSSVVKAGLIPALRRGGLPGSDHWFVTEMLPGTHPLEELEAALLRISVSPIPGLLDQLLEDRRGLVRVAKRLLPADTDTELLLVIDQFEELFTLVDDEKTRTHFIDNMLSAATDPRSRVRIILTLRADFYDRPLSYPRLAEMVRSHTEIVLPLTSQELERAIAGPAERVGLKLEPGLVATITNDVGEQPGTLPLLQYALTELVERREGVTLTLDAYKDSGGISGALARRADELYEALEPAEQAAARQLFLRLITLGEGTEDTRRRVLQAELDSLDPTLTPNPSLSGRGALDEVIATFSRYRLLTFDRDPVTRGPTVEIAHEALIREWKLLKEWLTMSRDNLYVQRRLMEAADEWISDGRDKSFLASGARLMQFEALAADGDLALSTNELTYLEASVEEREAGQVFEKARKAREAKIAKRAQNFGRAAIVLALVGFFAVFATVAAVVKATDADSRAAGANEQVIVAGATLTAVTQKIEVGNAQAESLRLAAAGDSLLQTHGNASTAVLLSIRALKINYNPSADAVLVRALDQVSVLGALVGHTKAVNSVAVSPDSKFALTGSDDYTARLWDLTNGKVVRLFSGHTGAVTSVAFTRDGKFALTGSNDRTARLWDVATGQTVRVLSGHRTIVTSVAISPDGKFALTGSVNGKAQLWDLTTGQALSLLTGHKNNITSVAFSPDSKLALTGSEDSTARLWDVTSGQTLTVLSGHTDTVSSVAFSPDGKLVLTGSRDRTARLWDVATGQTVRVLSGHLNGINSVAFSPDGKSVLTGSGDRIGFSAMFDINGGHTGSSEASARLWDVATGQTVRVLSGHIATVTSVTFSPDGKLALTSSVDWTALAWELAGPATPRILTDPGNSAAVEAISPNGKYILTTNQDKTAWLWDLAARRVIRSFSGHTDVVRSATFSPDSKLVLTGSEDKTARLWDVATGQTIHILTGHTANIQTTAFSPDGSLALTGSFDGTARLWDVTTGQLVRVLSGHSNSVTGVTFSPDGKLALTGSWDGTARLWDLATGKTARVLTGHTGSVWGVAFSRDGKFALTTSDDKTVRLWDLATGQTIRTMSGNTDSIVAVAFSPDGKLVLGGSIDRTARLWELASGQTIRVLAGHSDGVWGVMFSPDGKFALTGSMDGTTRIWDTDYHNFITYACTRVYRDFTDSERNQFGITDNAPTCPQFVPN